MYGSPSKISWAERTFTTKKDAKSLRTCSRNVSACWWKKFAPSRGGHQLRSVSTTEFSLTRYLARNALPLAEWAFKSELADMLDYTCFDRDLKKQLSTSSTVTKSVRFGSTSVRWRSASILIQLEQLDINSVALPWTVVKWMVFLAILTVTRMVLWVMQLKELYEDGSFFHHDLIGFFKHLHCEKIRFSRKRGNFIKFGKRWINVANLFVRNVTRLESTFPSLHMIRLQFQDSARVSHFLASGMIVSYLPVCFLLAFFCIPSKIPNQYFLIYSLPHKLFPLGLDLHKICLFPNCFDSSENSPAQKLTGLFSNFFPKNSRRSTPWVGWVLLTYL